MEKINKHQLKKLIESTISELDNETETASEKKKIDQLKKDIFRVLNQKVAVPFKDKEKERGLKSLISSLQSVLDRHNQASMTESNENISEIKVEDPTLKAQIDEFYALFKKFQEEKKKFEELEKKFKVSEDIIRTALESIDDSEEKMFHLEDYIIRLKKKGFERTDYKYKEVAEELYARVNPQIRAIIDEIRETNKKVTFIKSSIEVKSSEEEINEIAIFSKAKEIFSDLISKLVKKLHYKNQDLGDSIEHLESMV